MVESKVGSEADNLSSVSENMAKTRAKSDSTTGTNVQNRDFVTHYKGFECFKISSKVSKRDTFLRTFLSLRFKKKTFEVFMKYFSPFFPKQFCKHCSLS